MTDQKPAPYLTVRELQALLETAENPDAVVHIVLTTDEGMFGGEVMRLRKDHRLIENAERWPIVGIAGV